MIYTLVSSESLHHVVAFAFLLTGLDSGIGKCTEMAYNLVNGFMLVFCYFKNISQFILQCLMLLIGPLQQNSQNFF